MSLVLAALDAAPGVLRPGERAVLVTLAAAVLGDSRVAAPGLERLMQVSGLKKSQVADAIKNLVGRGLVRRVSRGTRGSQPSFEVLPVGGAASGGPDANPVIASGGPDANPVIASGGPDANPVIASGGPDANPVIASGGPDANPVIASGGPDANPVIASGGPDAITGPSSLLEIDRINQSARDDLIDAAVAAIGWRLHRQVGREHAALVADLLVAGRAGVLDPVAYVRGAILRDPNPARFLPTPEPSRPVEPREPAPEPPATAAAAAAAVARAKAELEAKRAAGLLPSAAGTAPGLPRPRPPMPMPEPGPMPRPAAAPMPRPAAAPMPMPEPAPMPRPAPPRPSQQAFDFGAWPAGSPVGQNARVRTLAGRGARRLGRRLTRPGVEPGPWRQLALRVLWAVPEPAGSGKGPPATRTKGAFLAEIS